MTSQTNPTTDEIVALETAYWEAIKAKDGRRTAELSGDPSLVTGARGAMSIPRARMREMTEDGAWTLESYAFADIQVSTPAPDVAIIAYTVTQQVVMDGKPQQMRAADSSTWVRGKDGWACHAHSEAFLKDAAAA
jgi:ketosteroid isomerase-like protein